MKAGKRVKPVATVEPVKVFAIVKAHTGETLADFLASMKEVDRVREQALGSSLHSRLWHGLDDSLRCYVLSVVAGQDWERWYSCAWAALPVSLRDALKLKLVDIGRQVRGASWH